MEYRVKRSTCVGKHGCFLNFYEESGYLYLVLRNLSMTWTDAVRVSVYLAITFNKSK